MASPPNPLDSYSPQPEYVPPTSAVPIKRKADEDPPWTGWDILVFIGITIGASVVCEAIAAVAAKLLVYKDQPIVKVGQIPEVLLVAQLLSYVIVFAAMYLLVESRKERFWDAIGWRWSAQWPAYLLGGAVLYFGLVGVGQLLPIPKHLPIDRFFGDAREATLMTVFAVSFAPFMEELFFRGFLYPVLARRLGMFAGILLTAVAFGIVHGAQLKYSWAVLIIFLVGVALTTVRAVTKSVGASFLMHVGYNGTLSLLMYVVTGGFRHLEKLSQ